MIGELCALVSACTFSAASIAIRRGMKTSRDNGTFLSTFVNMVLFLVLIFILYFSRRLPDLTDMGFLLFAAAGLMTTFSGRSLHYAAIRALGPSRAISFRMSSPIITVCLAFLFLSERFSVPQFLGAGAIIGGVWILSKETIERKDLCVVQDSCVNKASPQSDRAAPTKHHVFIGILFALGSALSFGAGHFVRKLAVIEVPSPFWGMAIGTTTAWLAMVVHAMVKGDLKELYQSNFNVRAPRWLFIWSGVLNSVGQMFIYVAIFFAPVSLTQVLATSEVLSTLVISRLFLGAEEPLGWRVLVSSMVVCSGVILMIIG